MNYIEFKFQNKTIIQRHEYSKILVIENNTETVFDNIELLPKDVKELYKDYLEIQKNPNDFFTYEDFDENKVAITSYIGSDKKNIIIPPIINGKKIVRITNLKSEYTNNVEKIILPDSVSILNEFVFGGFKKLKLVQLSPNIVRIPLGCFRNSCNLETVNLENIESIGREAFLSCDKLSNIDLQNTHTIDNSAFTWCMGLKNINLPNLTFLGNNVFFQCENLESVTLGDKLEEIGCTSFSECHLLETIKFPKNLKTIKRSAFEGCATLKKLSLPDGLEEIERHAFTRCGLTGKLFIPNTVKSIGAHAFNCGDLSEVNLSKNTEYDILAFSLDASLKIKTYDNFIGKIKKPFQKDKSER